mmetsp:Transcript_15701/g.17454  ORF Transcript_15701/g.17454 Transcript_15701/m.17454 type:complete len:332 (+) Transcript_15701:138-1133(+)|eukprot:CAMPEP_0168530424 /NCGR_PEP_ID=MMETSP0405-20121227/14651_1 /TAXON_ID=498012 /ORGANISM="Trichosphaerium sp, Strain Am-I-7 wt" /LENGTH=331 /DNA_ID=CAMNT_0008554647 /DNA_START=44 /DNA_END=1039 /DNA_ORIENTATION=-
MQAIVVPEFQHHNKLKVGRVPKPQVTSDGDIIVRVYAAGVNFFDGLLVAGKYQVKPPLPFIPGSEYAGVVEEVGKGVTQFKPGDKVFGNSLAGCFGEYVKTYSPILFHIPTGMTFAQAAGFTVVYGTSWAGLKWRGDLKPGETVLIHAAAGGVGLAAVQIAKALGAKQIIATAGSPEKLAIAKANGADEVINYNTEDFVKRVKKITNGRGVDVCYDPVGGDVFKKSLRCLAWGGRVVVVGFPAGIPKIATNYLLLKSISVVGLHWGAYQKHSMKEWRTTVTECCKMFIEGKVKPIVYKTYSLENTPKAIDDITERKTYGKCIIVVAKESKM